LLEKISNHNQAASEAITPLPCHPLSKQRMTAQQYVLYTYDGALSQAVIQTKTAAPVYFLIIIINLSQNWQGVLFKK
jgi:hypothetical protein